MFSSLTDKIDGVLKKLRGSGVLKEQDVIQALKEVRLALLEADVNFKVVKDFIGRVQDKATGSTRPRKPDSRSAGRQNRVGRIARSDGP